MTQYVLSNVTPTGRTLEPENRTITDRRHQITERKSIKTLPRSRTRGASYPPPDL